MPSKQELLDELQAKALRVFFLEKHHEVNNRDYYEFYRYYWADSNNIIRSEAVCIHVIVDDSGNEHAYWKDRVPSILATRPESTFSSEVERILAENQEKIGYTAYDVEMVNDRRQLAKVILYFENQDGTVSERRYLIWKDASGSLRYKQLAEAL